MLTAMRRRILIISTLIAGHFIVSLSLGVLYLVSVPSKMRLDAALSDHAVGWPLMVLSFPARNITNWLQGYPDGWLYDHSGFVVLGVASLLWGTTIYLVLAWLKMLRRAA
jgi:hypothetical protein